jgi:predicted dehydrogenase
MEPVRLGLIGCGVIGAGAHLPAATRSELFDVVALADLLPERVQAASERFGVATTYPSGDDLLRDGRVEAVVLAMPAGVRSPLALRALAAGKHVLLEKPIACHADQVRAMLAARGDRVVACCSPRFLTTESARVATACVASGVLGELRVVRARAIVPAGPAPVKPPPPWRVSHELNGGGILVNWGCYDLDYVMGLTGWRLRPRTVLAQTWPLADHLRARVDPCSDADNHFVALIRCDGGTVIGFERGEFVSAAGDEAWQILGSHGSLRLSIHAGKGKQLLLDESTADAGTTTRVLWSGDEDGSVHTPRVQDNFARAIRCGEPVFTSLERALVMQQITDAIYASARTGQAVSID